jgi:MFS family permease
MLPVHTTRGWMVLSAAIFGLGFASAWPVFAAYVIKTVSPGRRGAAYGALLAALDTGIGTGSSPLAWLIQRFGFRVAFGVAAAIPALAIPYFLIADRRWRA